MVYGTLKKGYHNNRLLAGQEFVREVKTKPKYRLYSLGSFPAMVIDDKNGEVCEGELWRADDNSVAAMDRLEGHPNWYRRQEIEVEGTDEPVQGYIYLGSIKGCTDVTPCWNGKY